MPSHRRTKPPTRALLAALAGLGSALFAEVSLAQTRVAVAPLGGPRGAEARESVELVLGSHTAELTVLADGLTIERLGRARTEADLARTAWDAGIDLVVTGELQRRGRTLTLRLRVLRSSDATVRFSTSFEYQSVDEITASAQELWAALEPALRGARGAARPGPENGGATPPTPPVSPPSGGPPSAQAVGVGYLHVAALGGVGMRHWRLTVLGESAPRGNDNNGFPELGLELGAYFRLAQRRFGLGVEGSLLFPVGLRSVGTDSAGAPVTLPTTSYEITVSAAGLWRAPWGGGARFGGGFLYHSFDVRTQTLPVEQRLAAMVYLGGRFYGEATFPLVNAGGYEPSLLFGAELRLSGTSDEARTSFGDAPGITTGVGGRLGLQLRLDRAVGGLGLRVWADLLRYRTVFAGRSTVGPGGDSIDDYVRINLALFFDPGG